VRSQAVIAVSLTTVGAIPSSRCNHAALAERIEHDAENLVGCSDMPGRQVD